MRTKILTVVLAALIMCAAVCGCSSKSSVVETESSVYSENTKEHISTYETKEQSIKEKTKSQITFETIPKEFVLKSGVFAIYYSADGEATLGEEGLTTIHLENDGSFIGNYYSGLKNGKGLTGDDYPNGTAFICDFKGKFSRLEKSDGDYYYMSLISLETEKEVGEIYYENGIKYVYSEPYGIGEVGDEFLLYLPGTKLADLQHALAEYYENHFDIDNSTDELSLMHYCLYNFKLNKLYPFFGNN